MEINKTEIQSSLEPYEAPAVEDVPLKPEDTVLSGCKTARSGVGSGGTRSCITVPSPCRNS